MPEEVGPDSGPQEEMPTLRQRHALQDPVPGEVVYDEVFTYHGHTIYIIVPPADRPEMFRHLIEVHALTLELSRETSLCISQGPIAMASNWEAIDRASDTIRGIYESLIGGLVVAWEFPGRSGANMIRPCTHENKKLLSMTAKAEMSDKIVELLRLWLMAL